jgi:hypothetical protein
MSIFSLNESLRLFNFEVVSVEHALSAMATFKDSGREHAIKD